MNDGFVKRNKQEQKEMAKTLASAFCSHDNFVYLIENLDKRVEVSSILFRFMTKVINKYGYIYVVHKNNQPIGYITFMDDYKHTLGLKTVVKANGVWLAMRFWLKLSKKERKKYRSYMKAYSQLHHKYDNTIHLYYVGVDPMYKGKGIMKNAISASLKYFKQRGYKNVILETSDQENVGLYQHLGYQVVQEVKTKDGNQLIYLFQKKL